jgi:hypothetical protein
MKLRTRADNVARQVSLTSIMKKSLRKAMVALLKGKRRKKKKSNKNSSR